MRVLVVDDERAARQVLVHLVSLVGDVEIHEASSAAEAKELLDRSPYDALLVDLRLSHDPDNRDGLTLVTEAHTRSILSVVVSGSHDIAAVRMAMRMGAHDYVLKDELSEELIVPVLRSIQSRRALEREVTELRSRSAANLPWLVGSSRVMQHLRTMMQRVALSDRPVLVTGPTGSGKELVVRAIHALGRHPDAPLLDLNCGAFPENLMEAQLFGHEKGAFTGADKKHEGFFAAAGVGTVFLDELAELPLELQAKLLRVLETGMFRPVGSSQSKKFMGRIVAATCANLEERVATGRFREDLFYRLNVLEVRVPSVEERREDVPMLLAHFAAGQSRPLTFTEDAIALAQQMRWPGNARQLRNLVDRLAVFAPEGPITADVLEEFAGTRTRSSQAPPGDPLADFAREVLKSDAADKLKLAENELIAQALRVSDGNKAAAARLLGVHRKVVERRTDRTS
jgi:DNA-binding NtrC family response regulator